MVSPPPARVGCVAPRRYPHPPAVYDVVLAVTDEIPAPPASNTAGGAKKKEFDRRWKTFGVPRAEGRAWFGYCDMELREREKKW